MKIKAKTQISPMNNYQGLDIETYERLNAGETVDIAVVPPLVEPYIELIDEKDEDNGD